MRNRLAYKNKKKKKRNWKMILWPTIFIIFLGVGSYFLFFSPVFGIKNISAEAGKRISADSAKAATEEFLNDKTLKIFPNGNYFIFSSVRAREFLQNKFPEIKNVEINKKISGSVAVKIEEREGVMRYCHGNKCYEIDEGGIIFEEMPEIYGGIEACLRDNSAREIKLKDKAIEPKLANFLLSAKKMLQEKINLNLVYFEISDYPVIDIRATTSENWQIIFDIGRAPDMQVEALKRVLEEKIKDQRNSLEYVDLRVENRVYYKIKK